MGEVPPEIEAKREAIDDIDDQIVDLLAEREELVGQISALKAEQGIPVVQATRFNDILARTQKRAEKQGVSQELVAMVFEAIHSKSVLKQMQDRGVTGSKG